MSTIGTMIPASGFTGVGQTFGAGTSATSALQSGLGGAASSGGSAAASAGMALNPIGLALGVGQLGLGIAQMIQAGKVREQQIYNQTYQNTLTQKLNEFARQQKNEQIASAFGAKLDFVKGQIENNFLAAQASWTSEQMRLNEIYGRAAFRSQTMQRQLAQAVGSAAAREVYGKSARRGAMLATLGAYGRSRAQLVDQLMSENEATQLRMKRTEQAFKSRNKLTIAQTEVLPMMQFFTPQAQTMAMGRGIGETIGGVLGAGISAAQTGYKATPEGGDFFGIEKKA